MSTEITSPLPSSNKGIPWCVIETFEKIFIQES